jgi:hypothetical protein
MKNLGWANGWHEDPPEYKKCRELGHVTNSADEGWVKNHGYDTVYRCEICDILWHVDSSD